MKRTTKYVALDVHQATTSATVRADGGRVMARTILPTSAPTLVEFFRGMRGTVHVEFEEGTQAQWLHDLLVPLVDRVIVADRRGASAQANKGDQMDADRLSELLRLGALRAVYNSSPHRETLARAYMNLVEVPALCSDSRRCSGRAGSRRLGSRSITRAIGSSGWHA